MKASDLIARYEAYCPQALSMEGDISGLQIGTLDKDINRVMVALDVRETTVAEAIAKNVDLIIVKHAPIFKPLGFGDWRVSTALITGFTAKESVVSTLTVLLGGSTETIGNLFNSFTAFVFLVFSLLYTPCVAAIAAVRHELGKRWTIEIVVSQCIIAWIIAFLVKIIGSLLL